MALFHVRLKLSLQVFHPIHFVFISAAECLAQHPACSASVTWLSQESQVGLGFSTDSFVVSSLSWGWSKSLHFLPLVAKCQTYPPFTVFYVAISCALQVSFTNHWLKRVRAGKNMSNHVLQVSKLSSGKLGDLTQQGENKSLWELCLLSFVKSSPCGVTILEEWGMQ